MSEYYANLPLIPMPGVAERVEAIEVGQITTIREHLVWRVGDDGYIWGKTITVEQLANDSATTVRGIRLATDYLGF